MQVPDLNNLYHIISYHIVSMHLPASPLLLQLQISLASHCSYNTLSWRSNSVRLNESDFANSSGKENPSSRAWGYSPLVLIKVIAPRHAGDLPSRDIKICVNHRQFAFSYVIHEQTLHRSNIYELGMFALPPLSTIGIRDENRVISTRKEEKDTSEFERTMTAPR